MPERQKPSAHGALLGKALARLADSQAADNPDIPPRCVTCAFKEGTVPNRMAGTLVEALDCVAEPHKQQFGCHYNLSPDGEPTRACSGWILACLAPPGALQGELLKITPELDRMNAEASHEEVLDEQARHEQDQAMQARWDAMTPAERDTDIRDALAMS